MSAILTVGSIDAMLGAAYPGLATGLGGHDYNESLINSMFAIAGVTDVTITPANNTTFTVTIAGYAVAVLSAPTGATAATIRDQFIAAILADPNVNGIIAPSANGALLRLTDIYPANGAITIAVGAGLAAAATVAHGNPTGIEAGVLVANATSIAGAVVDGRACRNLATGDVIGSIAGVTEANLTPLDETFGASTWAQYAPGQSVTVKRRGSIWVVAETVVARGAAMHARINPSGANTIRGAVRNAADGGNTVSLANGYFATGENASFRGRLLTHIEVNLPS